MYDSCSFCAVKFETRSQAKKHYLEFHQGLIICELCEKHFDTIEQLQMHKKLKH